MNECFHKEENLKHLENSTFRWCTLCGIVIHHIKIGGIFKIVEGGIYADFRGQKDGIHLYNGHDFRAKEHNHDWFKLTSEYRWCKICGALEIKQTIAKGFELKIRKGILLPKRKQVRLEILRETNLIEELHKPEILKIPDECHKCSYDKICPDKPAIK
jgi:hypothetical protein